jgi:hypothetical protein
VDWPEGLGEGLTRDLLAFTSDAAASADNLRLSAPDPLTTAILAHWPIWAAEQRDYDTPTAESVEERRLALIGAAERLPATHDAIAPKALASAWLAYVDHWRVGWTRGDHTTDGRLALDIHAILPSESAPEKPTQPDTPKSRGSLADQIDFASATLKDLVAIHDTAKLVGDVAQAVVWQGRCKAPSVRNPDASIYNAAGEFMVWLSDELTHVEHLAYQEMRKRQPADRWDRERRLAWIAAPIIQNGDIDETAAFIGELAGFMADEAKG